MKGSVYKRCACPAQLGPDGRRVNCPRRCGGTWSYRFDAGRGPGGKRAQVSKHGFATSRAAQDAMRVRMAEVERNGFDQATDRMTVGAYLTGVWLPRLELRESTRSSYAGHVRLYLVPHLGHLRLADLRATHLLAMYETLKAAGARGRPMSPSTLRRVHATVSSALAAAVEWNLVPDNAARRVRLKMGARTEHRIWTGADLARFFEENRDDRHLPAYQLAAATGMRRGELAGLRWVDVDLDAGRLVVVQQVVAVGYRAVVGEPKTRGSARQVALDAETITMLRAHRARQVADRLAWGGAWQDSGRVFVAEDGAPLHPDFLSKHFAVMTSRAGLPKIRLHDLRHTHASLMLAAGVPLKVVSDRLGHSSIVLTANTYTRVVEEVDRAAAESFASLVRAAGSDAACTTGAQPAVAPSRRRPART